MWIICLAVLAVCLIFKVVCYGGYHADMLDVGGVCIAVGDGECTLVGIAYFAQIAVGILCEFLGCISGIFGCLLYHGRFNESLE